MTEKTMASVSGMESAMTRPGRTPRLMKLTTRMIAIACQQRCHEFGDRAVDGDGLVGDQFRLDADAAGPPCLRTCASSERIDLIQLHRIDPEVPLEDQVGAFAELREQGKVQHIGLSEVWSTRSSRRRAVAEIAGVQNLYNLTNRQSQDVLDHANREGIDVIPWFPIATGDLAAPDSPVADIARESTRRRHRSRWPGCSRPPLSSCRSPARSRWTTCARTSAPRRWSSPRTTWRG